MDPYRTERLSEALREELAELIAYEMADPRVGDVTVSEVVVSPDKRHANVRIGLTGGGDAGPAIEALDHARGFLRRQLAQRLDTYKIPELHFEADISVTLGDRMDTLLKRVRRGRPRDLAEPPAQPASSPDREQADSKK